MDEESMKNETLEEIAEGETVRDESKMNTLAHEKSMQSNIKEDLVELGENPYDLDKDFPVDRVKVMLDVQCFKLP